MSETTVVLVTGATGVIGGAIARALAAMSRVYAREAAAKVGGEGLRWVGGADGNVDTRDFESKLGLAEIHGAQTGLLADMNYVADVLYERIST